MKVTSILVLFLVSLVVGSDRAIAQGRFTPACDSSRQAVERDEASLRTTITDAVSFLFSDSGRGRAEKIISTIEIEYVGAGRLEPAPPDSIGRGAAGTPPSTPPSRITAWVGINPATCNQFRMRIPEKTARPLGSAARTKGLDRANAGREPVAPRPRDWDFAQEDYGPPQTGLYFSGCTDTRLRSETVGWPARTIANFSPDGQSSSCTGTMVGPRHVMTAAHCVYGGTPDTWYDFLVIPGRNVDQWPFGSTQMSDTEGLNTGFRWYWIPADLLTGSPNWFTGLDLGILILPL